MFNVERWKEIFQSIQKNKLRTVLSGTTVSLGILIFIILFGLGEGLKNSYYDLFLRQANNVVYFYPGKTTKPYGGFKTNRRIEFDNSDVSDIKANFSDRVEYVNPTIRYGDNIKYKLESYNFTIQGVSPSNQYISGNILMKGRYINEKDIEDKTKVVVIGRIVERDIFKSEDPIGKFINIGNRSYKVIGVYQDLDGDNEESQLFVPYTTRQQILMGSDKLGNICLLYTSDAADE